MFERKGTKALSRGGDAVEYTAGGRRKCSLEGCSGYRLYVR